MSNLRAFHHKTYGESHMIPTMGGNRFLISDALSQADDIKLGACWEATQWMASVPSSYFFFFYPTHPYFFGPIHSYFVLHWGECMN